MDDKNRVALVEIKTVDNNSKDKTDLNKNYIRYQYSNHLGSALLELNENLKKISYEEYHPYGTTSYNATDKTINPIAKRYRYTGLERDEENGFGYHNARYYVPWLGRWNSADPKYSIDGLNLYSYCHDNPIKLADVAGTKSNDKKSATITKLDFSNEDGLVTIRPETYEEKYKRNLAIYEKGFNTPRGIDIIGKANFALAAIILGGGLALGAGASITAASGTYTSIGISAAVNFPRVTAVAVTAVKIAGAVSGVDIPSTSPAKVAQTLAEEGKAAVSAVGNSSNGATVGQTLLALRDKAIPLARIAVTDAIKRGARLGASPQIYFGNTADRILKGLVEQQVKSGGLPQTIRTTVGGKAGPDIIDLATRLAYDLTTATVKEVADHDASYIGKTFFGIIVKDVLPLLYHRD